MKKYLGIDLGGTNIALGVVSGAGDILYKISVPTKAGRTGQAVMMDIITSVYDLLARSGLRLDEVESIGIGVPGTANKETGVLEYANNLKMDGIPFVKILEVEFQKKILFENDAKAAAWGEYLVGAGIGTQSFVMMTLGTGVGGGIILDGKLYQGWNYASGEIGHMVIKAGGRACTCGLRGCLETYASATALIVRAKLGMNKQKDSLLWQLSGNNLEHVNGAIIFEAFRQKDALAKVIVTEYLADLALGCINIINVLQPEVLCIGGGISKAADIFMEPLEQMVNAAVYTRDSARKTKLVVATLANDAGIIGAALLKE